MTKPSAPQPGTLGTFAGVFTPSVLTILGIILFLRLGYVVGSVGVVRALVIILLANAISVLTTISLAAIATNLRVKVGGDYYLISRTLGAEYGGALGLVLFGAQSVSIAFYAIGFGEAISAIIRGPAWLPQAVAAVAVAALFVLAWLGADWATRFQYAVMAVLFLSIIAFFVGGLPAWDPAVLRSNLSGSGDLPFWAIFAIFFPAVTGFTQGVSMSGDLKDPGRSLPLGTFLAVGLSLVVYVGVALVFAGALPGSELVADYNAMRRVSSVPLLVDLGVIAATLSSALASFLGAPRILQSLAADRVFPPLGLFAVGHGPQNNPRRGVLLSAAIAFATIGLGRLNVIAPVVSMFFLISYGLLNYATYVEARASSPYFRPRFRYFDKRLSLLGGLGCLGAMLAIHPAAGVIAVVLLFAIHQYISKTVTVERWADSERSQLFQRVRDDLHAISAAMDHPRDWRPVVLAFSDDPERRERILRFARWLEGGSGFTTAVRMVRGSGLEARRQQLDAEQELRQEIDRHDLPAFAKAVVGPDLESLLPVILQAHGLGRVRANTVLLNWFDHGDDRSPYAVRAYVDSLRRSLRFGCSVVILSAKDGSFEAIDDTEPGDRVIDVWYRDNPTGRMTLMLAYLMTRTELWEQATVRLLVAASHADRQQALEATQQMLDDVRIDAEPTIVDGTTPEDVFEHSGSSSVVFLPFRLGERGPESALGGSLEQMVNVLGVTGLVLAAQEIQLDAEPEEGRHGEIAQAVDAAEHAQEVLEKVESEASQADQALVAAREALETARREGVDEAELALLQRELELQEQQAERLKRRVAKAHVKAEQTTEEAEAVTGKAEPEEDDKPQTR